MKLTRKQIIAKKLEINSERIKKGVISSNGVANEIKARAGGVKPKPRVRDLIFEKARGIRQSSKNPRYINRDSRMLLRSGVIPQNREIKVKFRDQGPYIRKTDVDYDAIICVSSHNRYDKINRLLDQIYTQETKYSFKFILLNDGSTQRKKDYDKLKKKYPELIYLRNEKSGRKINYWRTVNKMWLLASQYNSHGIVQLDDDFILCDNFLDRLLDTYFEKKEETNNYMVFCFHLYNFEKNKPLEPWWFDESKVFVDGGMFLDYQFLKKMNYQLDKIYQRVSKKTSSYTWVRVKERLAEFGMKVYRTRNSLVWHDGNDDSKLHSTVRKIKRVYTKNFIDEHNYEQ